MVAQLAIEPRTAVTERASPIRVLVVEDDQEVRETLSMAFSMRWQDSAVDSVESGREAVHAVAARPYNLVVLDVNLPDLDGFDVLGEIRRRSTVPIIMLTVRAAPTERVRGLEMGADDYVAKPFSAFELLARASAILRRSAGQTGTGTASPELTSGPITLNPETAQVFVRGTEVRLSPTEFKILTLLLKHHGKVVSRELISREVWGLEPHRTDPYLLKLHIQHLRRKLGDSGESPQLILTVRGFGYRTAS